MVLDFFWILTHLIITRLLSAICRTKRSPFVTYSYRLRARTDTHISWWTGARLLNILCWYLCLQREQPTLPLEEFSLIDYPWFRSTGVAPPLV